MLFPVSHHAADCTPPVRHPDRWISKILAAIIIVPLVLLVGLYLAFSFRSGTGAVNTTYLTADPYVEAKADHWSEKQQQEIRLWLDGCLSAPNQAYALRHELDHNGAHIIQYLIYYPAAGSQTAIDTDLDSTLLGSKMIVNFAHTDETTDYNLCAISVYDEQVPVLEVQSDGAPLHVSITDVTYNLTLFEILSSAE